MVKFKTATDFRKSLEARLKQIAHTQKQDLQRLRRRVAFDRLLARIFQTGDDPQFFLKGGYAMELRFSKARATRDIDLTYVNQIAQGLEDDISLEIFQVLRDVTQVDLHDFFIYQIGNAQMDLDNAPYGGARYPVSCFIDGRLFVRFQLDIGIDVVIGKVDKIKGDDWLGFYDIPAPMVYMITEAQQFAEKIHAYTLPREGRVNSRVKDLIDLLHLLEMCAASVPTCQKALHATFKVRGTHHLPDHLPFPPEEWVTRFQKMALECGIDPDIQSGYNRVNRFFQEVLALSLA